MRKYYRIEYEIAFSHKMSTNHMKLDLLVSNVFKFNDQAYQLMSSTRINKKITDY